MSCSVSISLQVSRRRVSRRRPMSIRKHRSEYTVGLTLIELLASLALTAMLLAVLLGVVGQMERRRVVLTDRYQAEAWAERFFDLVQADAAGAESIYCRRDEIVFRGVFSASGRSGQVLPGTILYSRRESPASRVLLREEQFRSQLVVPRGAELAAYGVKSFAVWEIRDGRVLAEGEPRSLYEPKAVRVSLITEDDKEYTREFRLR